MFRGFRWQLTVLIIALAVFAAGMVYRGSRHEPPLPAATPDDQAAAPAEPAATTAPTIAALEPPTQRDAITSRSTFREGLIGSVQRLNPLFSHLNPVDNDINRLIFEGLLVHNDYGEVIPRLAADLIISGDGLDYVLRLRDDIKWQDGVPFGVEDVLFTMSLLAEAEEDHLLPASRFWQTVETQRLGEYLLRFRLAQPFSGFPHLLTIGLLPEHALRGASPDQLAAHPFNLSPIGTGPYQLGALLGSAEAGLDTVQLLRSPVFAERPEAKNGYFFRELRFRFFAEPDDALSAYLANDIDAFLPPPSNLTNLTALSSSRLYTQTQASIGVLIFNWKEDQFTARRLRQALALSLDIPELIQSHLGPAATFADSPFVASSSIYQPHPFWTTYDLDQARSLLEGAVPPADDDPPSENAEAPPSGTGAQNRISLLVEDTMPLPSLASAIAAQWRLLGLQADAEAVSMAELIDRLESGRFQAAIVTQHIGAGADAFRFWHPAQHGTGQNYGAMPDTTVAELLESARMGVYSTRRVDFYRQFQEEFAQAVIAIPLYYPLYTYVARDNIEGIQLGFLRTGADRFRSIKFWRPAALTG